MRATSQLNPKANTAPIYRDMFIALRERLSRRPDSEHQAALIRIAFALLGSAYGIIASRMDDVISTDEWRVIALMPVFIVFSIGILINILIYPHASVMRRIISIVADIGTATYVLCYFGESGIPFYGIYLFNACGNGFRFGERYLYLSNGLSILGFIFVLTASKYWIEHRTLGAGLLFILMIIPLYFASLVRQLHDALERMRTMAIHDPLTGLPNRHSFYEHLHCTLRRAEHHDGFKPINDTLGHVAGDAVLKLIATRLGANIRANDFVARFGGDEFVIILADIHKTAVSAITRKIIATVAKPHELNGRTVTLTSSAGIAVYPDDGRTVDKLIARVDAAMYRAKPPGRNCFCFTE